MTDAILINDPNRRPVVAVKRDDGLLLQAGKAMFYLSGGEINRLIAFVQSVERPIMSATPAKARFPLHDVQ